jgi:hypothetical protein
MLGDYTFGMYFHDFSNQGVLPGLSSYPWMSVLHAKGWTGEYQAWELAGPAGTGDVDYGLYYRNSKGSSNTEWNSWHKIAFEDWVTGSYYNKAEVDKKITDAVTGGTVDLSGYLTIVNAEATYAKKGDVPTKTSQLTNDSGYITTNTTYAFSGGTDSFTVTPSGGSAQTVLVNNRLIQSIDNRDDEYVITNIPCSVYYDFKYNNKLGVNAPMSGTYSGVMTWRAYGSSTDLSGGPILQLAYDQNGNLWKRNTTSAESWSDWKQLLTTDGLPDLSGYATQQWVTNQNFSKFSGSYDDLTNKPTIPTKVSELVNDEDFITSDSIPTKTSQLDNDSGFITGDNYYTKTEADNKFATKDEAIISIIDLRGL